MTSPKRTIIFNWKKRGLIYDDYDALYEVYINTMECQHCESEFTKNNKRCLDHDHTTGLFRKIICNQCNACDSYIKYPFGYSRKEWCMKNKERIAEYQKKYQERNRESILKYKNQKVKCECGCIVTMSNFSTHKKSKKHIKYIAGYI